MKQHVNTVAIDLAKKCCISWGLTRREKFSSASV